MKDKPNGSRNPLEPVGKFLAALTGFQIGLGLFLLWAWGFGYNVPGRLGFACLFSTVITGLAAAYPGWWE